MLPKILNLIRMIWVNSDFYKTRERLTGLLRKVNIVEILGFILTCGLLRESIWVISNLQMSNEIIKRCCADISLDGIFTGYVQSSMKSLEASIDCCEKWKDIYTKMSRIHHKFSQVGWVLDKSSIFAQVDAFVQRCKDLLEVRERVGREREGGRKGERERGGGEQEGRKRKGGRGRREEEGEREKNEYHKLV